MTRYRMIFSSILSFMVLLMTAVPSHAVQITFFALLDGPSESPPVASPGTGQALVVFDTVAHTLSINASFQDLVGTTTVAHIHCCTTVPGAGTVGVAVTPGTLPLFPAGVTSGTYATVLDLTQAATYTTGFLNNIVFGGGGTVAGAEAALLSGLRDGEAYFNIHSTFSPGGEIRGFLTEVPEPSTWLLLATGTLGLLGYGWRTRRSM